MAAGVGGVIVIVLKKILTLSIMNQDQSPSPDDTNEPHPAAESAASGPGTSRDPFQDIAGTVRNAFQNGGRDARRAFDEALPKAKADFAKGLHDFAYTVAYAAAFGGAVIREITPDNLKEGIRDGARTGQRAAEEMMRQRREKAERESRETPPVDGDFEMA